ncbi:hypothetical protein C7B61_00545, partial [filamentous cyanobacterium CCP1]
ALRGLGSIYEVWGNDEQALDYLYQALALFQAQGETFWEQDARDSIDRIQNTSTIPQPIGEDAESTLPL